MILKGFDWDPKKEVINLEKHGVSFSDAEASFQDPQGFFLDDELHSLHEERLLWVGKDFSGKVLTTWITFREGSVRIIGSAELRKYRKVYYEITKKS